MDRVSDKIEVMREMMGMPSETATRAAKPNQLIKASNIGAVSADSDESGEDVDEDEGEGGSEQDDGEENNGDNDEEMADEDLGDEGHDEADAAH